MPCSTSLKRVTVTDGGSQEARDAAGSTTGLEQPLRGDGASLGDKGRRSFGIDSFSNVIVPLPREKHERTSQVTRM